MVWLQCTRKPISNSVVVRVFRADSAMPQGRQDKLMLLHRQIVLWDLAPGSGQQQHRDCQRQKAKQSGHTMIIWRCSPLLLSLRILTSYSVVSPTPSIAKSILPPQASLLGLVSCHHRAQLEYFRDHEFGRLLCQPLALIAKIRRPSENRKSCLPKASQSDIISDAR